MGNFINSDINKPTLERKVNDNKYTEVKNKAENISEIPTKVLGNIKDESNTINKKINDKLETKDEKISEIPNKIWGSFKEETNKINKKIDEKLETKIEKEKDKSPREDVNPPRLDENTFQNKLWGNLQKFNDKLKFEEKNEKPILDLPTLKNKIWGSSKDKEDLKEKERDEPVNLWGGVDREADTSSGRFGAEEYSKTGESMNEIDGNQNKKKKKTEELDEEIFDEKK